MVEPDFRLSEESRPVLGQYAELPLNDPRRRELFTFLADAVADPNGVAFQPDEIGLRWSRLERVAVVWRLDLPNRELDVIDVWDEDDE